MLVKIHILLPPSPSLRTASPAGEAGKKMLPQHPGLSRHALLKTPVRFAASPCLHGANRPAFLKKAQNNTAFPRKNTLRNHKQKTQKILSNKPVNRFR